MGGKPSKGTPADMRLKGNKKGNKKGTSKATSQAKPRGTMPRVSSTTRSSVWQAK